MNELKKIGVYDNSTNRALLQKHLDDVVGNSKNILGTELRSYTINGQTFEYTATIRESFFMGPSGGVKIESVWEGKRLLNIIFKGGN